jgi:anti-sigma regulatory factor (Ser/Thr protein kinase)
MIRSEDIPRDSRAPAVARHLVDELDGVIAPEIADPARLLLSEVVTNAVRHGEGDVVRVLLDAGRDGALRCEITDAGQGFVPVERTKPSTEVGGWGLHLLETMSRTWGVLEDRTRVWFELVAGAPETLLDERASRLQ